MPAALAEARKNLVNPPKIYTEIAIEQIDGNISFFKNDVPAAFKDVTDAALLAEFKRANDCGDRRRSRDYKTFLQKELLPKSTGSYAFGARHLRKALAANEMVDLPLDRLLADRRGRSPEERGAFQATAKQIDPTKPADAVLASLQNDHPPPPSCCRRRRTSSTRCGSSSSITTSSRFRASDPAHVKETPPFMRSTTTRRWTRRARSRRRSCRATTT